LEETKIRYSVHALIVIILLLNCGRGDDESTQYPPPLTDVATLEMSFGAENVPDEFLLFKSSGLCVTNTGDVCDVESNNVIVYDKNGKPKIILGRKGEGPGEFQRAGSPTVSPAGYLTVRDIPYKMNIYSPELDLINTINLNTNFLYRSFFNEISRGSLSIIKAFAINENDKIIHCNTSASSSETPFFEYNMILYEKNGEIHTLADYNSKSRVRVGSQRSTIPTPFNGNLYCDMLTNNRIIFTHTNYDFIIEGNQGYYILNIISLNNLERTQIKHSYVPQKIPSKDKNISDGRPIREAVKKALDDKDYIPHVIEIITDRNFAFVYTTIMREIDERLEFLVDIFDIDKGKYIVSAYMPFYSAIRDGYVYDIGANEEGFAEIQKHKIDPVLYGK